MPKDRVEGKDTMAASYTGASISLAGVGTEAGERANVRRSITPQAGHALEILGHAIEYLTDQYIQSGVIVSARSADLEAVRVLMGLNRQIYYECPEAPSFFDKVRHAFGLS